MARKLRVHYSGALYHVIVRGNNKAYIFRNEDEKKESPEGQAVRQDKGVSYSGWEPH